jgi:hypothetical protein
MQRHIKNEELILSNKNKTIWSLSIGSGKTDRPGHYKQKDTNTGDKDSIVF